MIDPWETAAQFTELCSARQTPDELLAHLQTHCAGFGVRGCFVANVPPPGANIEPHILLRGWNLEWIDRYARRNYVHVDPIARRLTTQVAPFTWASACRRRLAPEEALVMDEAREFGLAAGFTVPIYGVLGQQSCVSFAIEEDEPPSEYQRALHLIAIYAHLRLVDLSAGSPPEGGRTRPQLSRRELECVKWTAQGKTAWEIGQILALSERTVEKYLTHSMRKLGAVNRTHAVAIAIRRHLLT